MIELEKILEEVRETAKGTEQERLTRCEIGIQQIKSRLDYIERNINNGDEA